MLRVVEPVEDEPDKDEPDKDGLDEDGLDEDGLVARVESVRVWSKLECDPDCWPTTIPVRLNTNTITKHSFMELLQLYFPNTTTAKLPVVEVRYNSGQPDGG